MITYPLRYGAQDPRDRRRFYQLEIVRNRPFENKSAQPNFTLYGQIGGYTTEDTQLGAQRWLTDHASVPVGVTFDSDGEEFVAHSDDLEPLIELVTLLRSEIDGPPMARLMRGIYREVQSEHTEAWAAMIRREEKTVR